VQPGESVVRVWEDVPSDHAVNATFGPWIDRQDEILGD
jgi:hypothetical protein